MTKPIDKITIQDLQAYPIWEFDLASESKTGQDETWVKPLKVNSVDDLGNRVIGTEVLLANGTKIQSLLSNVDLKNVELNQEFICISILRDDGSIFHLSRYFDPEFDSNSPQKLSDFLNLKIEAVFPISYDISKHCNGNPQSIKNIIKSEPEKELTDDERMDLIIENM